VTEVHAVPGYLLPADALLLLHRRHEPLHFRGDVLAIERRAVVSGVGNERPEQAAFERGAGARHKAAGGIGRLSQGVATQSALLALENHADAPRAENHPTPSLIKRN